jgi:hypothetical protein
MEEAVMPLRGWNGSVRYGLPGLLLGLALSWWGVGRGVSVQAQPLSGAERARTAVTPATESGGVISFISSTAGSAQLLYLIDTRTRAFAIYRVDPSNPKGAVKLEGARQYNWDLKLTEFNNQPPEVAAIESTVKTLGRPTQ